MPRLRRPLHAALGAAIVVLLLIGMATVSVVADTPTILGRYIPDPVAYAGHWTLGTVLNATGGSPVAAANQWVRAASHARTFAQVSTAAGGIATARQQSGVAWEVDDDLCVNYANGAPPVRTAVQYAGLTCSGDPAIFTHVPVGTPLTYDTSPPVGGQHYGSWYPTYGLTEEVVDPGYWVHNMEHGAVVLLYRCADDCPELKATLAELYAALPPGTNDARAGGPRLLITHYESMDRPFAVIAWGHGLQLDRLDTARITAFYQRFVDRGPECRQRVCP